jgi:serine/threonine-protein kinase
MSLTPGGRLGLYEVVARLGAGGMGEVYRARDTRLNRDVAIKALQASVASDPERVARFEREAQLLASLNHPNIGGIYGLEESGGATYLVLELVDGKPLDAILRESGAMPLSDVLPVARQIADAVAAAHDKGIVHRDLKPANVMVTGDGQVKVLDFGLGKSIGGDDGSAASQANSPTITIGATQAGIILGTAAYMSPEQAKGRAVDKRSDVWSFGCVLFEMLTGRRAFQGEDVSDTLASVLKESPDFGLLPPALPPGVRLVVERCLTKDRAARLSDMSTARFLLTEPSAISTIAPPASHVQVRRPAWRSPTLWMTTTLLSIAATIALAIAYINHTPSTVQPAGDSMHVSIRLPEGDVVSEPAQQSFAVSPDGKRVAYTALSAGKVRLFIRELDSSVARPLAGTEGAGYPFFSLNGQWVGFVAQGKIRKASVGGGAVETLGPAAAVRGAGWGDDGYIYFPLSNVAGISRIPEGGGTPAEVTHLDAAAGEISHRDPQVLPGGKAILFTVWKGPGPDEKFVAVQPLSGGAHRILIRGGADGRYVPPGYLAYARSDELFAVRFDLATLEVAKTAPVLMDERIIGESTEGAAFAVSASGTLAYLPAEASRLARRVVWQDLSGRVEPLQVPTKLYEQLAISPDGASAVVQIVEGSVGLWILDLARATLTPLVTTGGSSQAAVWTADSKYLIYRATRNGVRNLYRKSADGTGDEERLTTRPGMLHTPYSVSPDGEWVLFGETSPQTDSSMFRLHLTGAKEILPIAGGDLETDGQVSPSGKWLAFDGQPGPEIYVRAFPGPGPRIPMSRNGGTEALWSRDGKSLYFLRDGGLNVVDVSAGATFSAGTPRVLIDKGFLYSPNSVTSYSQGKDGRILHVQPLAPDPPVDTIGLVLNWGAELAKTVK